AFTASSGLPSIYIQQFWDTILYDKKAGCYKCQLDGQWFDLTKETLREALQITHINHNQAFAAPPSINGMVNFVNQLGYPKLVINLSTVVTNDMFQPWRELLTIINLCLTGNTSGFERPRAPVLQILWGIRKHRFHPRPESPLHRSNEEPVHGYLKFSAKGTKREIFGMPIPGRLIMANIRAAPYYQEYQENVAKHKGLLAGETRSTHDLPAPRPAKPARKPQSTIQKAPPKPSISSPVTSTQPAPISSRGSPKSVGASEAEEVPVEEPQVAEEDLDFLKAVEESMKDAYALPKGPLPPVVIRELESGKYQPLLEVPEKGKAKVSEEQVAHDLLSLQKHKKTNSADQYIFQSEEESKKVVLGVKKGSQDEGQARPDPNAQAEGQTGSVTDREHMDIDVSNVSLQPSTKHIYEGFTATIYPNVQDNLKLAVEELVLLEDPASSSGTLSSLQHLSRDFTFGDQFLCDKPSDADKSAETEVKSMVNVSIQQAMSSISLMTSPIIDLTLRPESPKELPQLKATTTDTTTTTTTTLPPPQAPQQSTTKEMMVKRISELEHTLADLIQVNKTIEERDSSPAHVETDSYKSHEVHMQLFEALENSINRDQSEELAYDLDEAWKKKKKSRESLKTPPGSQSHQPPPPPLPAGPSGTSWAPRAPGSQVTPHPPPPPTSTNQDNLDLDEATGPDEQARLSDEEDTRSAHIPTVNLRQGWWKPFEEERPTTPEPAWLIRSSDVPVPPNNWASTLASNYSPPPKDSLLAQTGDITTFIDWFCKQRGITKLKPQDLEGPAYEIVKVFHPDVIHLQYQMDECHKLLTDSMDDPILRHNVSKPLPLGGPPSQVTIQSDFFFNKDLQYLRYGSKGRRPALSISKMKAAYYPDAGLEQMVPDQFWIEEECKYDIAAMYGISHWWFQRQRFYIDRHTSEGDRSTVRTHMRILSIYLYPSDFEDLNLLNLQGYLNHLPPKDKKILTTAVNQWTRQLVIRQRVEDFQLGIESYQTQDKYKVQMMMRFNEIYKFSDGTLQQIVEALDYRVKEFRINRMNPGLNTRFWTRKDVDRCNAFMFAIQRRLRTRRIFRNLESFVGGRVREGDYRLLKRTD
nr:monodehydroascorbate reductase [Tanacetum cinerariifolium]